MIIDQQPTLASTDAARTSGPGSTSPGAASKGTSTGKAAATKPKRNGKTAQRAAAKPKTKAMSKQDKALSLLRRAEGSTIATIMKATGWQKHSVHGFLAGVVRKKLGLNLKSADVDGKRIYRIVAGKPAKAAPKRKGSR